MKYRDYLEEVTLDVNKELNTLFQKSLGQVFNQNFVSRIDEVLDRSIKIKEVKEKEGVVAYNKGGTIFVNKDEFYKRDRKNQIQYLLHEFIHVLQRKRGFLFRKFREIKRVTNNLNAVLKDELQKPMSVFLTGKNQKLGPGGKWEILSYLMNNSINWKVLSEKGQKEFMQTLKKSGIFNLDTAFWKERLPNV